MLTLLLNLVTYLLLSLLAIITVCLILFFLSLLVDGVVERFKS
jgi:hypothetical protein